MIKQNRKYMAVLLSLGILLQGMLMSCISVQDNSYAESAISQLTDHNIIDHYDGVMFVSNADLSVPLVQEQFSAFGLLLGLQASFTFHFANKIKTLFLLYDYVDLLFGIKELKFPSHYFW